MNLPDEALNMQQRLKTGSFALRKNKAKIAMGRKRAARKVASPEKLKLRAMKQARMTFLKKITKGADKGDLSMGRRAVNRETPREDETQNTETRKETYSPKFVKVNWRRKRGGKKSD